MVGQKLYSLEIENIYDGHTHTHILSYIAPEFPIRLAEAFVKSLSFSKPVFLLSSTGIC